MAQPAMRLRNRMALDSRLGVCFENESRNSSQTEGCLKNRLWCAIRVVGAERSLDALSGDALRHRHPKPGHPVEHRAADPGFGLLGRQSPGAKTTTDESSVAEHGGLSERAPAV